MKYLVFLLGLFMCINAKAQFPGGTDTLRRFNNRFIDNDAKKAFTNLRLHNLLAGIIDQIDSAAGGGSIALGMDTLWAQDDSTLIYRKNGLFYNVIVRGATGAGPIYRVPFSDGAHLTNDSNFLFDKSQGANASRLIVGPTTISSGGLAKINATSDNMNALGLTSYGTGLNTILFRRARGSIASPTGLLNDDDLFNLSGRGYTGSLWTTSRVGIFGRASQNWTDTTNGTRLYFATTPNDSVTMVNRMIIDDSLQVHPVIAASADSIAGLRRNANGLVTLTMVPNIGGGGGSTTLSNVGSGYRLVKTSNGQIKTLFPGYGIVIDSTTNTDGITYKADTTSANHLITQDDLNNARPQSEYSVTGDGTSSNKFKLVNDQSTPNKWRFYGTDIHDSTKGFHEIEENFRGVIYNVNNWASASAGFTNNAVTLDIVNGNLHFTSGSVYGSLDIDALVTDISKYEIEDTVFVIEKSATSYGNGIGTHGINPVSGHAVDIQLRFEADNGSGAGKLILTKGTAHNTTISSGAITFNAGDTIVTKLKREGFTFTGTGRNVTQNTTPVTVSYTFVPATDADLLPNIGKFAIFYYGGEFTVSGLKITSNYPRNGRLFLKGDSRFAGYQVTSEAATFGALANQNYKSTIVSAGGYDRTVEHLLVLPQDLSFAPQQVLICLGYNDIVDGPSLGTIEDNLDSIYNFYVANNIDAYFLLAPTKSPAASVVSLNSYLRTTYPNNVFDVEQLLLADGALAADGVHWTEYGNQLIHDFILRSPSPRLYGGNDRYGSSGGATIAGTTNNIPIFTGPTSLGNSSLSSDGIRVTNSQMYEGTNTAPDVVWNETDGGTNEKIWSTEVNVGTMTWRTVNDARSTADAFMQFLRSGNAVTVMRFLKTARFEGGIQHFYPVVGSESDSSVVRETGTGEYKIIGPRASVVNLADTAAALRTLIDAVPVISTGTYTPTLTGVTNVTGTTAYACQYMRVGNIVTVSGKLNIDFTSTGLTQVGISLPIASAISNDFEVAGTGSTGENTISGAILGDATNNRAQFDLQTSSSAGYNFFFTFTYQIL